MPASKENATIRQLEDLLMARDEEMSAIKQAAERLISHARMHRENTDIVIHGHVVALSDAINGAPRESDPSQPCTQGNYAALKAMWDEQCSQIADMCSWLGVEGTPDTWSLRDALIALDLEGKAGESNPSQPAPLAKDEAASLPSACGGDARYKCHKHYGQVDADGTASDYDRARALAEQWADVFGADVPARINLTRRVAALLGDVRRETIQACAAWLEGEYGEIEAGLLIAAMTKKDGEP